MYKQFAKLLSVLALSLILLTSQVGSIYAQGLTPTSTPVPGVEASDPSVVTFSMFRQDEMQLTGPYDSNGFLFSIPADWKLTEGSQLEISLGASFNTVIQNQVNTVVNSGGTLTVLLDNQALGVIPLNQVGEITMTIPIPLDRLVSQNIDQSMALSFVLNSGISCYIDQNTILFIHPSSRFILPHESVKPDTSFVNFPRPIYQNSIIADSALLVVPDKPTASEMRAALTVSAGMSNLSNNSLLLDMTTVSGLTDEQKKVNHIILVGKSSSSLSTLAQLDLPMPINNNQFEITGGNPDDGVLQMVNSPWSVSHVILFVSGNSDVGIVKAAQAVSTGVIQPNYLSNLAVIDKVETIVTSGLQADDRTLADMGYRNVLAQKRGINFTQYSFNVPLGFTLAHDAYFELVYGNSALLNYNRSGIVVQLNNRPIGSVRLSEVSAGLPTNKSRILIPSSAVVPGRNVLQLVTTLWPTDDCTPPGVNQGLWVNIWSESLLHLPLTKVELNLASVQKNLANYQQSFLSNSLLSDTAFVLPGNNLDAWRSAVQVAAFLGNQANGAITDLSVFYGDDVPAAERSKYNFLMIGRPSEMPIVNEIKSVLPAPFNDGNDVPTVSKNRITYRIPPEVPLGFVEFMPSVWNSNNVILAVFGNTTQGVSWATAALIDPTLSSRLAGNFAVVNNRQIITTDSSIVALGPGSDATQTPNETVLLPAVNPTAPAKIPVTRPVWILPALGVSIALILLILAIVLIGSISRNRIRGKKS